MHRSRLGAFVIDCKVEDLDAAAEFWSRALGKPVAPVTPDSGAYRELKTPDDQLQLILQQVDHPSRIHLDIEADDLEAEVKRLEGLGARRLELVRQRWWVMEAPTGHRFCVVRPQRGPLEGRANEWGNEGGPSADGRPPQR
jgi:predicted enzyme related to lactoylglutathione lyase